MQTLQQSYKNYFIHPLLPPTPSTYNLLLFALSRNRKVLRESVNRSHQLIISSQNRKDFTITYIVNNEQLA